MTHQSMTSNLTRKCYMMEITASSETWAAHRYHPEQVHAVKPCQVVLFVLVKQFFLTPKHDRNYFVDISSAHAHDRMATFFHE